MEQYFQVKGHGKHAINTLPPFPAVASVEVFSNHLQLLH